MRRLIIAVLVMSGFVSLAHADSGLVQVESPYAVEKTMDRLEIAVKEKGMTIFARINHAEGAKKIGQKLRPTELLIFGNPKVGSKLMNCGQTAAIDLPQKMLAWQDQSGQVWLAYNDPDYLQARHGMGECGDVIGKIRKVLKAFSSKATE